MFVIEIAIDRVDCDTKPLRDLGYSSCSFPFAASKSLVAARPPFRLAFVEVAGFCEAG
jgi:hypothetical protein